MRVLLMNTLPVHTAPFLKKYDMNRTGVHFAPAIRCCLSPFKTQSFVMVVKKAPIASLNSIVINSISAKETEGISIFSVFGAHNEKNRFQNAPFLFVHFHYRFGMPRFYSGAM